MFMLILLDGTPMPSLCSANNYTWACSDDLNSLAVFKANASNTLLLLCRHWLGAFSSRAATVWYTHINHSLSFSCCRRHKSFSRVVHSGQTVRYWLWLTPAASTDNSWELKSIRKNESVNTKMGRHNNAWSYDHRTRPTSTHHWKPHLDSYIKRRMQDVNNRMTRQIAHEKIISNCMTFISFMYGPYFVHISA